MYKIPIYCKCQQCEVYFEVAKRRKYCTRKCRDAHYYDTKVRVNIVKRYESATNEAKEWWGMGDKHLFTYANTTDINIPIDNKPTTIRVYKTV